MVACSPVALADAFIGQAKGILMERFRITADQAFTRWVRASQESQQKLHEVAGGLAAPAA